jgi:hypothetical protein
MRVATYILTAASAFSSLCVAQQWELGAAGGYGFYANPTITGYTGSVEPGFAPKGVIGVVFGQNMYEHVGGEIRWLYQYGGPQLKFDGVVASSPGYSNLVTYDVLYHTSGREANLRPYIAAGAGVKIYTSSALRFAGPPAAGPAVLLHATQVEPAISAGAGLKYRVSHRILVRLDFRTYFSPSPDEIFRPIGQARTRGWVYNFVPLGGISLVF